MHSNSRSESYAAAGVDITAGYKAVELMKKHIGRTRNEGCLDDVGGFGGCFGLNLTGMEVKVTYNDGTSEFVKDYQVAGFSSEIGTHTISVAYAGWVSSPRVRVPKCSSIFSSSWMLVWEEAEKAYW